MTKKLRLVAYCRRSTSGQEDSIDTQQTLCRRYCDQHGHEFLRSYCEPPLTGATPIKKRPVASKLFDEVTRPDRDFDGIIVLAFDRLSREPLEEMQAIALLGEHDCALISVADPEDLSTDDGELFHGIKMFFAKKERRTTARRVREHNLGMVLKGEYPGGTPAMGLTYSKDTKKLSVNDRAPDVVRLFEQFIECGGNAHETARRMNLLGIDSRNKSLWRHDSILATIRNPMYRQKLVYQQQTVYRPDVVPEVVPQHLVEQIDDLLQTLGPRKNIQRARKYLYSYMLRCSQCGSVMRHNGRNSWRCAARATAGTGLCNSRNVCNKYMDRLVGKAIEEILSAYMTEAMGGEENTPKRNPKAQMQELEAMKGRIWEAYLGGHIKTPEDRDGRLAEIDKKIEGLKEARTPETLPVAFITEWAKTGLAATWTTLPDRDRRQLLDLLDCQITLNTEKQSRIWVDVRTILNPEPVRVYAVYRNKLDTKLDCQAIPQNRTEPIGYRTQGE